MFKNFGLTFDEISSSYIRQSAIGRWTIRFFFVGLFCLVFQGCIYFAFNQKHTEILKLYTDGEQQYKNTLTKLKNIESVKGKAYKVLEYRNNAHMSFMPIGLYYAVADAIVPGMAIRDITLERQKSETSYTLYKLSIKLGYDTRQEDPSVFLQALKKALSKNYGSLISVVSSDSSKVSTSVYKDTIYKEQTLNLKLKLLNAFEETHSHHEGGDDNA